MTSCQGKVVRHIKDSCWQKLAADLSLFYRYECEGRSAGALQGAHSTPENRTYPTIKIEGYKVILPLW